MRDAKFDWGVAPVPYWPDVKGAPCATTVAAPRSGSSTHRTAVLPNSGRRQVPRLPEVNAGDDRLAKTTGFLPATNAAFKYLTTKATTRAEPKTAVAIGTLANGKQGEHTGGYRFGRWTEIPRLPP